MSVRSIKLKNRIAQLLYQPQKSKFFNKETIKDFDDLDKALEKTINNIIPTKKKKK